MDMYDLKYKTQMPIILRTDPMSRYLDIKSGEIVRITRNSVATGETLVYRVCV
jgi:DNA-directed RNA polymerase I, II, and III subunit RPABC1